MAGRESGRIKEAFSKRVLDEETRKRRQKKALEALEQDNFHDDPLADLVVNKKAPKFQDDIKSPRRRKGRSGEYFKAKYRKNLAQLIEEDLAYNPEGPNYTTAAAPPSNYPERHFCAVCGYFSTYTCIPCGARYCSVKCLNTHLDTRCMKWTA